LAEINALIAYLMILKESEERYTGGIMVTDPYTIPVEFKYTEPLKPTGLQKILYGKSIEKFIWVDVIARKLIQGLQENPRLLLIQDKILFPVPAKNPVCMIASAAGETKAEEQDYEDLFSDQLEGGYQLISKMKPSPDLVQWVQRVSREVDILEPFNRLKEALQYVCLSEPEKQSKKL